MNKAWHATKQAHAVLDWFGTPDNMLPVETIPSLSGGKTVIAR